MIYQYTSTSLTALADALARAESARKSVFSPHFLVTGHRSTYQWLRERLAFQNGIAAHLYHKNTDGFIDMMYQVLEAGPPRSEAMGKAHLVWLIDGVLADYQGEHLSAIRGYYEEDPMKRFTFAEKLAGLFEQYQSLEPAMLRAWEEQPAAERSAEEQWQRAIWLAVKKEAGEELADRSMVYHQITEALKEESKVTILQKKISSISFFGTQYWTKELLHLISELSKYLDIRIYRMEAKMGGSLLTNYLGAFQRQQDALFQEITNGLSTQNLEVPLENRDNLLHRLQRRIRGEQESELLPADDSVTISNHFSIYREVEGLYHYLVYQLESNDQLKPRDIVVITPDSSQYTPAIKTIFDQKAFPIPYTLYDTSFQVEASPWKALEALLSLESSRFTATAIMSLLDFQPIREHFGITQLALLQKAIKLANIRHSWEGDTNLETNYSSWRYGFRRLILGACLPKMEEEVCLDGAEFFPVGDFEGSSDMSELLRFYNMVETLHNWLERREEARNMSDWVLFVQKDTLEQLLDLAPEEEMAITRILADIARAGDLELNKWREIPFGVLRHHLRGRLSELESGSKTGYGGVRFVGPNYLLSTPATIYAFLGMNSSDFPRVPTRLQFDLTGGVHPTATDLDKHLFLAMLLASEQKCYISYIGQNIRDNSVIPPSSLTSALVQELSSLVKDVDSDRLIVKHPLHSFSNRYNQEDRLIRYGGTQVALDTTVQPEWIKEIPTPQQRVEPRDEKGRLVFDLSDMIRYYVDPIKYYYQQVWRVYPDQNEEGLEDAELFTLDQLQKWMIEQDFLAEILNEKVIDGYEHHREPAVKKGRLPLKSLGAVALDGINGEMEDIRELIQKIQGNYNLLPEEEFVLKFDDKEYVIRGTISNLYSNKNSNDLKFVFVKTSSDKYKHRIECQAFFQFIKEAKKGNNVALTYISETDRTPEIPEVEMNLLLEMAELYRNRFTGLLPFIGDLFARLGNDDKITPALVETCFEDYINNERSYPSEAVRIEYRNGLFRSEENCQKFIDLYNKLKPALYR